MFPELQYWANPTTYGAVATVIAAVVAGFFASWIGADKARSSALDKATLELTNGDLRKQLASTERELKSTRADLIKIGGSLGVPDYQTPEQRAETELLAKIAHRRYIIDQLVTKWAIGKGDGIPDGYGVTWWPVDYINKNLEDDGREFRVYMEEGDLKFKEVPVEPPPPWASSP